MKDIILDCDPGQDDALAILLALGSADINLKAITVVGGNVSVDKCYLNAMKVLTFAGRTDIPVYRGANRPLKQNLTTLENVFGESGMAGTENWKIPKFFVPQENAVDFLIKTYSNANNYPHLCATAPQTNIAQALLKQPQISENIPGITIMGGCVFPEPLRGRMGNISVNGDDVYAEYNFAMDPEAADITLCSSIQKINLIGLDITRRVLYNGEVDTRIRKIGTKEAIMIADMLSAIGPDDMEDYAPVKKTPTDPIRALHDAVAMCYLVDDSIFKIEQIPIKIDLKNFRGQSLIAPEGRVVNVIRDINKQAFFDILCDSIANLKR
ncbi:MAG: nucleoside hydrolase [Alphaproteobacteria bacterium]|nr:nucleoside hydrolase [Alphaproteobacteria bacterium]